ncbi:TPA: hypothetical protein N0F65_007678 [Lagenidium giganteum]|uniref:Uncharacterized protein n=1 Tax=Lagenidium giganteum TaxID=4803 RepID=A0AAV2ZAJ9_9STRA|nr:TPA: hypothetical protein N0F65_007678 [Lagenidium giganteum]
MVAKALQRLTNEAVYYGKEAKGFLGWTVPGAVIAGWLVWPGLTQSFKEETLGLKPQHAPGSAAAVAAAGPAVFRGNGKYKYVRNEIGERPTLEEE